MIDEKRILRKRDLLPINDLDFEMHDRRHEHIVGKKIEIGKGRACDKLLGCTFEDCEIRVRCSGRMTDVATRKCRFKDCLIWPDRIQKIATWEAQFEQCLFKGKYEVRFSGPIKDCDFSRSVLNHAMFLQEEGLGEVMWPIWPHIVIQSPMLNYDDWKQVPKPREFNRFLCRPEGIACIINLADAVDDPQAFWQVIKDKHYVKTCRESYL